ncbi:MAG: M20/M25/M40 family metallo-hydrolase [Desulfobacterales bacterium]|nr:MAG: M20/M25/M40 family metallo-hydrolase [Desulfobacterales bacterium]
MEAIIQLTKDLIAFKSMHSRPEEINHCAEFIERYLRAHAIRYKRLDYENYPSILVMPPCGAAPVLLMSHIDVVDAPDELFRPVEKDGKLFGRGSIDDKYAAALSLVLLKEQLEKLRKENKSQDDLAFGILITADEEIGGFNGARKALQEIKTDFCIALDGGTVEKIVVKEKGIVKLKLISKGQSAHGSRPWLGENAIDKLFNDYRKIKGFFDQSTPDHWHRTLNFGIVAAGQSFNQVPDYAEATFDIRYTENDSMDELLERMQAQVDGELVVEMQEPLFRGGDSPYLDLLLEIAPNTIVGFEHGASDARFLSDYGIKGIVWGANGDMSQHSPAEHVNIESVNRLYRILETFIAKAGARNPG